MVVRDVEPGVGLERVGVERRADFDGIDDARAQHAALRVGHDFGSDAAATFDHAEHGRLEISTLRSYRVEQPSGWRLAWNFQPHLELPTSASIYTPGESR